jgi:hypothetical protein
MKQTLNDILAALVRDARAAKPKAVKRRLGGGLVLNLRQEGGAFVLILWRATGPPSIQEWNVVTSRFPFWVDVMTPDPGVHDNKYYLRGRIPDRQGVAI